MDFDLSEDERALADGMRRLCQGRFPLARLRAGEGDRLLDRAAWAELAGAGVFSLRAPEASGGAALGMAQAAVVFEELGRALVAGPLVASHLAAGLVEGAADGEVVVGVVRRGGPSRPALVAHLESLGALLVLDDNGLYRVDPSSIDSRPVERSVDPLTPLWQVVLPEGEAVADAAGAASFGRDHAVLSSALLVGMASATLDMAVAYATTREQFGRPIGAFQAVKHLCADMLVRADTARCAVWGAALTIDQPDVGDGDRAAAGAALLAVEAASANAKSCIQVHGGMGFTWEVPAHLYLMRSRLVAESLEPTGALADTVAERF
ncbi:MAG TPA: acyl-CoA dehydrogenase family protein [Acidimicrobiales bacterium]|nr:acyl-CoA dehydrogenase family protein [Acidimicrobiales bacterium]